MLSMGCVWIFSGIAHYEAQEEPANKKMISEHNSEEFLSIFFIIPYNLPLDILTSNGKGPFQILTEVSPALMLRLSKTKDFKFFIVI